MTLSPEILTILILDILFLFFATIAFYLSLKISLYWDANATTKLQYSLEKKTHLSATIIKYIFAIKVPLLLFFVFTLDKISNVISGAMCAAGVVDATDYGSYLLVLKILNLYLFAYWIVLNNQDVKDENQPYVRQKFTLFLAFFVLLVIEIVLELIMFNAIDVSSVVDCCGVIYSSSSSSYFSILLNLEPYILLSLFYGIYVLVVIGYIFKKKHLFSLMNLLFLIISLLTLISFFGTYVYELPTHRCPFCFLQSDYNYIGYLFYILLFVGTFSGLVIEFIQFSQKESSRYYKISIFFNTLYVVVVTYYPVAYYLKNGVLL
jgi:hypothetical protein